jgi:hypothetical protein
VLGAVAVTDLGESPIDRDELAVRGSCHVAEGQRAGKHVRYKLELEAQNVGKSAFIGFDDGVGVVGNEAAQHGVGVLDIAKVTGTVQRVQARRGRPGRVADVVQPRGGFQEIGIRAENGCQTRARAATPWTTCAQRRGSGSYRSARERSSAHEASAFMRTRLGSRRGTFTDVVEALARQMNNPDWQALILTSLVREAAPARGRRLIARAFRLSFWAMPLDALAQVAPTTLTAIADQLLQYGRLSDSGWRAVDCRGSRPGLIC